MTFTWACVGGGEDSNGGRDAEYQCVEHPRLTRLVQRPNRDADYVESYHVEGLTQYYHSPTEALAAMHSNPEAACF